MTHGPRVLLLIPHLGGGGAEQVTALLARGLSQEKYDLHLGLVTQAALAPGSIPSWVTVHPLGARRVRAGALRLLRLVWRLRPRVILSNMAHLNFLVLLLRPLFPRATRVVVRQNATLSAALACERRPRRTRLLYRLLYPRADRIICPSQAMALDLAREIGIGLARTAVLSNPIDTAGVEAAQNGPLLWSGPGPHLLAVGRLAPEKGFDLLLEALAEVHASFPRASLILAGAGPEEDALRRQCARLGLLAAVRFAGYVERPYLFFPGATAFVLTSRHEGIPNALLEAAAGGLPIVALPSSAGVVELLRNSPGAWVASEISAAALASTLLNALVELRPGQRFTHPFLQAEEPVQRLVPHAPGPGPGSLPSAGQPQQR